ncbi:MAG: hypothetical protein ACI4RV_08110 [Eubacteriales bacterium]
MFDSWKIVKVWEVSFRDDRIKDNNAFFCFSPLIEYRVTDGHWMVFQTENDYISIGANGVKRYETMPFATPEYDVSEVDFVDEDDSIEGIETTLFVGERLIQVDTEENRYVLHFDDFTMYLYPFAADDFWYACNAEYLPIKGFERHITRKCECGGEPELMLDFVSDFYIRCSKCHKSTWATYELRSVIDDWNNNETETVIDTAAESFAKHIHEPIKYIALDEHSICYDENLWDCNEVVIAIGDALFGITGQRVAEDQYDFKFGKWSDYNRKMKPYLIVPSDEEPISFVRIEHEPNMNAIMRLSIGDRPILITAENDGMRIGLSHWGLDDEWLEFDNNVLVNGKQG